MSTTGHVPAAARATKDEQQPLAITTPLPATAPEAAPTAGVAAAPKWQTLMAKAKVRLPARPPTATKRESCCMATRLKVVTMMMMMMVTNWP